MNTFQFIKRMSVLAYILLISHPLYSRPVCDDIEIADTLQRTKSLNEVIVNGVGGKGNNKIGHISLSGAEINKRPALLGEHDVIKALQSTSGVVSGTEGLAGLYVRGGETDQNLYLLDGLPLLNVYHFGGLFSTFSTHSIDKVDFYKGNFPTLFSERASSIVDVALKSPDYYNTSGTFSVGLISGQVYFTTPLKKGTSALSVALRRTWFDVFSTPALAILNTTKKSEGKKIIFHYNFTDLMVKLSVTDRKRNDISFLLFYGKDNFKLGNEHFDPKKSKSVYQRDLNKMSWGNWGITLDYKLSLPIGNLKIQPYLSKAFASDKEENMDAIGNTGSFTAITETKPSVLQISMKETFNFPILHGLEGEAGLQQTWYDYNVGNPIVKYSGITAQPVITPFSNHSKNGLLSGFAQFNWNIADVVQGSAGLRANRYLSKELNHWNMEPRVNMTLNLPYESNVSLGYSRVAQYAQQVSSNYIYLPSDAWLPTASHAKPLVCGIYSLGYYKTFKEDFNLKGELWWKDLRNIAEFKPNTSNITTNIPWYDKLAYGKGWAYGLDLETEGKCGRISWTVAYGLMWNWRKIPGINSGKKYPAKFDNRHKLDINLGWQINDRMELTGNWTYMTGNCLTLALYNIAPPDRSFPDAPFINTLDPWGKRNDGMDYFENRNNVRIPSFHRLNLNLSVKGHLKGKLSYQWDFGLYNAYWRLNPFTVVKNYVDTEWKGDGSYRKFHTFSLLPILPSVSYTLNF